MTRSKSADNSADNLKLVYSSHPQSHASYAMIKGGNTLTYLVSLTFPDTYPHKNIGCRKKGESTVHELIETQDGVQRENHLAYGIFCLGSIGPGYIR